MHQDLRMGGRVAEFERAVAVGGQHLAVAHEHGANGHLAARGGAAGFLQGQIHETGVGRARWFFGHRGRPYRRPAKKQSAAHLEPAPVPGDPDCRIAGRLREKPASPGSAALV
jgi:hypothetical protein